MPDKTDSEFYATFKGSLAMIGLPPPPEMAFGSVALATATLKAMAEVIGKLGTKVTVKELILAFPTAGSGALVATALGEVLAVVGALSAAYYFGACAGAFLGAAVSVYGTKVLGELSGFFADVKLGLRMPLYYYFQFVGRQYPRLWSLNAPALALSSQVVV